MHVSRAILTVALVFGVFAPGAATANLGPEEALELVRAEWFESIPEERLDRLSKKAVRAVRELLEDPDEANHHAMGIELLGLAGGRGAYRVVVAYEQQAQAAGDGNDGEISTAIHRARMAVPVALGRLAQSDDRALRMLLREADRSDGPRWHTRRMNADRVERLHRELCATGLGLSGRDEAPAALQRMRANGDRESWRRHIAESIELHQRSARNRHGRGE